VRTLIISPHPDDELLGCGGYLIRRASEGGEVGWALMTRMSVKIGYSESAVAERMMEIDAVRERLRVRKENFYEATFGPRELDRVPMSDLVEFISKAIERFQPTEVLIPFFGDIHSDHRTVYQASRASVKWFRAPSIETVLMYETPSESDILQGLENRPFSPNFYVDISDFLVSKLSAVELYRSEIGAHPFPRSLESLRALAIKRGSEAGFSFAEAFELVFCRNPEP
jgi:N-acetylglucosamine malate deacetylase 1